MMKNTLKCRMTMNVLAQSLVALSLGMSGAAVAAFPDKTTSVEVVDQDVKTALSQLLQKEGIQYRFEGDVAAQQKITLEVADAKWREVFEFIVEQNQLKYQVAEDGTVVFSARAPASVTTKVTTK